MSNRKPTARPWVKLEPWQPWKPQAPGATIEGRYVGTRTVPSKDGEYDSFESCGIVDDSGTRWMFAFTVARTLLREAGVRNGERVRLRYLRTTARGMLLFDLFFEARQDTPPGQHAASPDPDGAPAPNAPYVTRHDPASTSSRTTAYGSGRRVPDDTETTAGGDRPSDIPPPPLDHDDAEYRATGYLGERDTDDRDGPGYPGGGR